MQDRTETLVPTDSLVVFQSTEGFELRATILRLTRHLAVFEIYGPGTVLQMSEALNEFRIIINDRVVYSGKAVVRNLIPTNTLIVCEVTLEESWVDVDLFSSENQKHALPSHFEKFLTTAQKTYKILPEVKLVVADMQLLFMDLRIWLDQVELAVRSQPSGDRQQFERAILQELQAVLLPILKGLFERFELICQKIDSELRPVHCHYVKRQLHAHVLSAPFMYRTFQKPLGYA